MCICCVLINMNETHIKWKKNNLISNTDSAWPALAGSVVQAIESLQVSATSLFPAAVLRLVFQARCTASLQRAGVDTAEIRNISTPGSQVLCKTELARRSAKRPSANSTKTHAPSAPAAPWLTPTSAPCCPRCAPQGLCTVLCTIHR